MTRVRDMIKAIAKARIQNGKNRKDFLLEMAKYWKLAMRELEKEEIKWLLSGL